MDTPSNIATRSTQAATTEAFVRRHQRDVWRYLRALGCDDATADDLTQDALVAALEHGVVHLPAVRQCAYLRRTAKNGFLKLLRRASVRPALDDIEQVEPFERAAASGTAGGTAAGTDGHVAALTACLERVRDRARLILDRRYRDGATSGEIARELGVKEALVNTIFHRTKRSLRRCIEARLQSESEGRTER